MFLSLVLWKNNRFHLFEVQNNLTFLFPLCYTALGSIPLNFKIKKEGRAAGWRIPAPSSTSSSSRFFTT